MEAFKILDGGLLSSVQDLGRYGYQRYGVSCSGVMDEFSAKIANKLVKNDESCAVIETTLKGLSGEFLTETLFAITGGECDATLNGEKIKLWKSYKAVPGDELKMGFCKSGLRNYIAFLGGVDVPVVMKSRSTNLKAKIGGVEGRKLVPGDVIKIFKSLFKKEEIEFDSALIPKYLNEIELRVILGQQYDYFTKTGIETFFNATYDITNDSDRMGVRLSGEAIEHIKGADIISDGITFGAIQVPGNGQPIVMMADRQTTGGYTKIGNVISVDLEKLAQSKPGTKVKFKEISEIEAIDLLRDRDKKIKEEKNYKIEKIKEGIVILEGKKYNIQIQEI